MTEEMAPSTAGVAELLRLLGPRQTGVGQVGIIVSDLDAALELHAAVWDIGPWQCFTYGPATVPTMTYRGRRGVYSMRIALAGTSPQLELIQPIEGPSIYHEWMEQHGNGLHHLAYIVDSLDAAIAAMKRAGVSVAQSGYGYGLDGDGGYAYFDTEATLGIVIEALEPPRRRRPPERIWPPGATA